MKVASRSKPSADSALADHRGAGSPTAHRSTIPAYCKITVLAGWVDDGSYPPHHLSKHARSPGNRTNQAQEQQKLDRTLHMRSPYVGSPGGWESKSVHAVDIPPEAVPGGVVIIHPAIRPCGAN